MKSNEKRIKNNLSILNNLVQENKKFGFQGDMVRAHLTIFCSHISSRLYAYIEWKSPDYRGDRTYDLHEILIDIRMDHYFKLSQITKIVDTKYNNILLVNPYLSRRALSKDICDEVKRSYPGLWIN
jgi:hypothetical protein